MSFPITNNRIAAAGRCQAISVSGLPPFFLGVEESGLDWRGVLFLQEHVESLGLVEEKMLDPIGKGIETEIAGIPNMGQICFIKKKSPKNKNLKSKIKFLVTKVAFQKIVNISGFMP